MEDGSGSGKLTTLTTLLAREAAAPNASNLTVIEDLVEAPGVRYTLIALHIIAMTLASVGNGFLIVFILCRWRSSRYNVTASLVLNLAVCDFVNVTVHQPMRLIDLLVYKLESRADSLVYCKVSGYFSAFFGGVAFLTIVAISQERLLLICYPFRAKQLLTFRNVARVLVAIWAVVALTVLPIPIVFTFVLTVPLERGNTALCLLDPLTPPDGKIYIWFLFILYFAIPFIAITATYARIFRKLNAESLYSGAGCALGAATRANDGLARVLRARKSLAKMMLGISVIFVISIGPHFFVYIVLITGHDITRDPIFTLMVVELLTLLSPMMNPIVYSVRAKAFQKGVARGSSELCHSQGDRQASLNKFPMGWRRSGSAPPLGSASVILEDSPTSLQRSFPIDSQDGALVKRCSNNGCHNRDTHGNDPQSHGNHTVTSSRHVTLGLLPRITEGLEEGNYFSASDLSLTHSWCSSRPDSVQDERGTEPETGGFTLTTTDTKILLNGVSQ